MYGFRFPQFLSSSARARPRRVLWWRRGHSTLGASGRQGRAESGYRLPETNGKYLRSTVETTARKRNAHSPARRTTRTPRSGLHPSLQDADPYVGPATHEIPLRARNRAHARRRSPLGICLVVAALRSCHRSQPAASDCLGGVGRCDLGRTDSLKCASAPLHPSLRHMCYCSSRMPMPTSK